MPEKKILQSTWKDCCFSEGMEEKGVIVRIHGINAIESYSWNERESSLGIQSLMSMREMKPGEVK